jgi:hypothetical protein
VQCEQRNRSSGLSVPEGGRLILYRPMHDMRQGGTTGKVMIEEEAVKSRLGEMAKAKAPKVG